MKEGWMKNEEWWWMKDEWWRMMTSSCWGVLQTNRRTDICECRVAFATENFIFHNGREFSYVLCIVDSAFFQLVSLFCLRACFEKLAKLIESISKILIQNVQCVGEAILIFPIDMIYWFKGDLSSSYCFDSKSSARKSH